MRLADLEHAADFELPAQFILNRVQRRRTRKGTVSIGALRLPPRGLLHARFDLADDEVGYFAEAGETAIYETLARREASMLTMPNVEARALLTFLTTVPLQLIDLRFHANAWPVLQSLRYPATQQLAQEIRDQRYAGIAYRSAQQHGADRFAIFGRAMATLRLKSRAPLVHSVTGALHRAAADAIRGSQIPLAP